MYVYACEYRHPDGRISYYVGKHERPYEKSKWYLGSGKFCQNFKNKYGEEYTKNNVVKKILMHSLPDSKTLSQWEKIFIASYRLDYGNLCRNQTKGGDGGSYGPVSEETRKKMSDAKKGRNPSEEHKKNLSKATKKQWKSPKFRAKMAKIFKSPEYKTKKSEAMKEVCKSPEYRAKMSKNAKELWKSDEYRVKNSGKNNHSYDINSVTQIHKRAYEAGDIKTKRTYFNRVLKNPNHKKHDEYTKVYKKHLITEG